MPEDLFEFGKVVLFFGKYSSLREIKTEARSTIWNATNILNKRPFLSVVFLWHVQGRSFRIHWYFVIALEQVPKVRSAIRIFHNANVDGGTGRKTARAWYCWTRALLNGDIGCAW